MKNISMKIKKTAAFLFCTLFLFSVFAQKSDAGKNSILTARDFFQIISERYGAFSDYEADVEINASGTVMRGHASFKRPSLLRIDFSNPSEQVILFNGDELVVYVPKTQAILRQSISKEDVKANAANLATPQGLSLMSRYYTIAYENGPQVENLDSENPRSEKVIKLYLERKNSTESFRRIKIAINPNTKLIRQVSALNTNDQEFTITFTNYSINQSIPDTRFLYDTPPTANEYNNFLFTE